MQPLSGNCFHWLTEGIAILARIQPFLDGIDHVIVPKTRVDYQRDALNCAGIPHDKLIGLSSAGIVVCERLFAPTFRSGWLLGPDEVGWLLNCFLGVQSQQNSGTGGCSRRLYIARSDARSYKVINDHCTPWCRSHQPDVLQWRHSGIGDISAALESALL